MSHPLANQADVSCHVRFIEDDFSYEGSAASSPTIPSITSRPHLIPLLADQA